MMEQKSQRPSLADAYPRRRSSGTTRVNFGDMDSSELSTKRRSSVNGNRRHSLSLGDRVEQSKKHVAFPEPHQLWGVCLTILAGVVSVFVVCFFVNDAIMRQSDEHWRDYSYRLGVSAEAEAAGGDNAVEHEPEKVADVRALRRIFQDTNPVSDMDPLQFQVYLAFFLAITLIQAGLGLELLVWISFLQNGWSEQFEHLWKFAQFAFPLLTSAALGMAFNHEYMSMILLVPGIWKFGMPETHMYMYSALYNNENTNHLGRVADFLNSWGTAVHHSASAFYIAMFLAGVATATPAVMAPVLVLVIQHWFALLHYVAPTPYLVLELLLEVWFEWTLFSYFHEIAMQHWTVALAATAMIAAHWMYLSAALFGLLGGGSLLEEVTTQLSTRQLKIDLESQRQLNVLEEDSSDSISDEEVTLDCKQEKNKRATRSNRMDLDLTDSTRDLSFSSSTSDDALIDC